MLPECIFPTVFQLPMARVSGVLLLLAHAASNKDMLDKIMIFLNIISFFYQNVFKWAHHENGK